MFDRLAGGLLAVIIAGSDGVAFAQQGIAPEVPKDPEKKRELVERVPERIGREQVRPGLNWLSAMRLLYGQTSRQEMGEDGERFWGDAEKSGDLIEVESILRVTRGWAVDSGRIRSRPPA